MKSKLFLLYVLMGITFISHGEQAYSQFRYITFDKSVKALNSSQLVPERKVQEESSGSVTLSYSFPGYTVVDVTRNDQSYQMIQLKGFGFNLQVGAPALPTRSEKVAIPANTRPVVSIVSSEYEEYEGYSIAPSQRLLRDGEPQNTDFVIDENIYSKSTFYPAEIASIADIQIMRGVPLAYLDIYPVQYNPITGVIRVYKSVRIKIDFKPDKAAIVVNAAEASPNQVLKNMAINPQTLAKFGPATKAGVVLDKTGYIIVTVPKFQAAADTLAKWKRQLGYKVEIVSQSTWTVAQVKNAVLTRYNTWNPKPDYLLVLGDIEDIPTYHYVITLGSDVLDIYSTNYFVCFDGASDYLPELAHGRITPRTATEALDIVQKIIRYEKDPPVDPTFYDKAMVAGFFEDENFDHTDDKRYFNTALELAMYLGTIGYQVDEILCANADVTPLYYNSWFSGDQTFPPSYLRSNGYPWDGDKNDIINSLNDGRFLAFHRDHGKNYGWVHPYIDTADFNALSNGFETPVILSINCQSGAFQHPQPAECFAERMLRYPNGGAVGVIASTEISVSGFNDGIAYGLFDAIWPIPGIDPDFRIGKDSTIAYHNPIYTMGDVLTQGLIAMTQTWKESWSNYDHFHEYHYFGDPAMQLWTAAPTAITATHTTWLEVGSTSLTVNSSNCLNGIATVYYGNDLKAKIRLQNGQGTINFPSALDASVDKVILTISYHNYKPYIARIDVGGVPQVAFSANLTGICPQESISFTDASTHMPTSWTWSFTPSTVTYKSSTNLHSQNPIVQFDQAGTYTVALTATNSYGSATLTKNNYITVHAIPAAPVANDANQCYGEPIPQLSATGSNVKWYDDAGLTTLLHQGNTFTPSEVLLGSNDYYVTQTVSGCVSVSNEVILYSNDETRPPMTSSSVSACEYAPVELIAGGDEITWYAGDGFTVLAEGDTFNLGVQEPGEHYYYVSNTTHDCESGITQVKLMVYSQPDEPLTNDVEVCEGTSVTMEASGSNIKWYTDAGGTQLINTGESFELGSVGIGEYSYFVSQTIHSCESNLDTVNLIVYANPIVDLGNDTIIHLGDILILSAQTEGSYRWFDGSENSSFNFISKAHGLGDHICWLEVTNSNNCVDTDSVLITVKEPNGYTGITDDSYLLIYPNPTHGILNIECSRFNNIPVCIIITDTQGREIYKEVFRNRFSQQQLKVDLSGQRKGVYLMRIENSGFTDTIKIILD